MYVLWTRDSWNFAAFWSKNPSDPWWNSIWWARKLWWRFCPSKSRHLGWWADDDARGASGASVFPRGERMTSGDVSVNHNVFYCQSPTNAIQYFSIDNYRLKSAIFLFNAIFRLFVKRMDLVGLSFHKGFNDWVELVLNLVKLNSVIKILVKYPNGSLVDQLKLA